jgi:DNA-binding protein HU-beta
MNRSELIEQVAEKAQTSKAAAARVLDAVFDAASGTIAEAVRAGQHVSIPGFGKFKPRTRPARMGRNPKTGATIQIPERTVVGFTPGKALRDTLGGKPAAKRSPRAAAGKRTTAETAKPAATKAGTAAKKTGGAAKGAGAAMRGRAAGSSRKSAGS